MKFGLVGENIAYSMSPYIHETVVPSKSYHLIDIEQSSFDSEIPIVLAAYDGLNVTIPYKEKIMNYLDKIDPLAKSIGAVNTVFKQGNTLIGYNTDSFGIAETLDKYSLLRKGERVVILGTGGASRAVLRVIEGYTEDIVIVSRRGDEFMGYPCYRYHENLTGDLLINATPLGRNGQEVGVDLSKFNCIFDLIYSSKPTPLIEYAIKHNIPHSDGLYMLVSQALKSREIWDNLTYDIQKIHYLAMQHLANISKNIYIVGMPGSGKTTFGSKLAEYLRRPFVDLDRHIEAHTKKTIKDIFDGGESHFREIETQVLRSLSGSMENVVSLGGGAVNLLENRQLIGDGIVVFLRRPIEEIEKTLDKNTRPMFKTKSVRDLYKERLKNYVQVSDFTVDNTSLESALIEFVSKYHLLLRFPVNQPKKHQSRFS